MKEQYLNWYAYSHLFFALWWLISFLVIYWILSNIQAMRTKPEEQTIKAGYYCFFFLLLMVTSICFSIQIVRLVKWKIAPEVIWHEYKIEE